LKRPAKLAASKPDTSVKILNKSAYYVIKDCAEITLKYLPHFVYSGIRDPITKLRGQVTEQHVIDFVNRSAKEDHTQQLLRLILDDISRKNTTLNVAPVQSMDSDSIDFTLTGNEDDVYGDYDYEQSAPEPEPVQETITTNVNDLDAVIEIMKNALCV
jgi:hypothetical protein